MTSSLRSVLWHARHCSALSLRIWYFDGDACGLWHVAQSSFTGACVKRFSASRAFMSTWHFWQRSDPNTRTCAGSSLPCGSWQARHSPAATGPCTNLSFFFTI